jgi:hypothetical protein
MWTERQLKLLENGGNVRLREFCEKYNLLDVEIKLKYQTKALQYYRRKNEALALGKEFTEQEPSLEEGRTLLDGTSLD